MKRKLEVVIDDETYAKFGIAGTAVSISDARGTETSDQAYARFINESDAVYATNRANRDGVAVMLGWMMIDFLDPQIGQSQ